MSKDGNDELITINKGGLQQQIEKITTPIQFNTDEDDPNIEIRVGTNSNNAFTRYTESQIGFFKTVNNVETRLLYIDSAEAEGVIDINNARIHNSIRIGNLEIFEYNEGIAIRRS